MHSSNQIITSVTLLLVAGTGTVTFISHILRHRHDDSQNHLITFHQGCCNTNKSCNNLWGIRTRLSCIINAVIADALATQGPMHIVLVWTRYPGICVHHKGEQIWTFLLVLSVTFSALNDMPVHSTSFGNLAHGLRFVMIGTNQFTHVLQG